MAKNTNKKKKEPEERINVNDIIAVYDELDELKQSHPELVSQVDKSIARTTLLDRLLAFYLKMHERFHIETRVKRKTYLWLCLLGPIGVHHFYAKHWIKGLLYLAFCWSGIPVAMTFIDWMEAVPKKGDEDGMIVV